MASKRAKTITKEQFDFLLGEIKEHSEHPLRDEVALRLSFYAGLRACEIANLRWDNNILDARGNVRDVIHITDDVAKRSVERTIPTEETLRDLLKQLRRERPADEHVFYALHNNVVPMVEKRDSIGRIIYHKVDGKRVPVMERDPKFVEGKVSPNGVVQFFKRMYAKVQFEGCSSHSGRRTFVTARARLANLRQCSIEDVRILAGHKSLATTAAYIEPSPHQRDLVGAWD